MLLQRYEEDTPKSIRLQNFILSILSVFWSKHGLHHCFLPKRLNSPALAISCQSFSRPTILLRSYARIDSIITRKAMSVVPYPIHYGRDHFDIMTRIYRQRNCILSPPKNFYLSFITIYWLLVAASAFARRSAAVVPVVEKNLEKTG
jgi:hypothetical protein